MVENLLNTTCKVLQRVPGSRDDWGNWQFNPSDDIDCLFIDQTGRRIKNAKGEDVIITGVFVMIDEIEETDKIIYDGYEYEIVSGGIEKHQDILTGVLEFYRVNVIKRRAYGEESITVS